MSDTTNQSPIHKAIGSLDRSARSAILKLARRNKLIDTCFKEFQRQVYPGAPPDQVRELRTAFFAGAAELQAVLMYGADVTTADATDADLDLMRGVTDEIDLFHRRTMATMQATSDTTN